MSRRGEIEAYSNARIIFTPPPWDPLGPPTRALPLDPTEGLGGLQEKSVGRGGGGGDIHPDPLVDLLIFPY